MRTTIRGLVLDSHAALPAGPEANCAPCDDWSWPTGGETGPASGDADDESCVRCSSFSREPCLVSKVPQSSFVFISIRCFGSLMSLVPFTSEESERVAGKDAGGLHLAVVALTE